MPTAQKKHKDLIRSMEKTSKNRGEMTSSNGHGTASKNNPKNKSAKSDDKKRKKKKKSSLAFWFCMSGKTDNVDKDSQPYPAKKEDKPKGKKEDRKYQKAKDQKSSSNDRKSRETDREDKDRRRHRHSAPPTEWVSFMAALEEQENDSRSNNARKSRSKSPAPPDIRYRFDGTLEKPYVYPGGLTFKGEPKKKIIQETVSAPSRRVSRKGGNVTEVEVHYENPEGFNYESDEFDEKDIRKQFYLRYDSHMRKKSSKKERRYSMPVDLQRKGSDSPRYGRGESRWIDRKRFDAEEEIYDEPYESETEINRRHLEENAQPSSYYSQSPPLKDSEFVYMWHSCEDLQKCNVQYHSEEEIRSSRECLPQSDNKTSEYNYHDRTESANSPRNNHSQGQEVYHEDLGSENDWGNNNNVPHSTTSTAQSPVNSKEGQTTKNVFLHSPVSEDDISNVHNSFGSNSSHPMSQPPHSPTREQHYVKNTKPFDNPFKRNAGRSSCMPGNKRFFLPPPPAYTPPREEFEIARARIAAEEEKENKKRSFGSQTDLTEVGKNEEIDMADRDQSFIVESGNGEVFSNLKNGQVVSPADKKPSPTIEILKGNLGSLPRNISNKEMENSGDNTITNDFRNKVNSAVENETQSIPSDFIDDKVVYHNMPPPIPPRKVSTSSTEGPPYVPARGQAVVTSTPKAQRRTELSTKPVPYPRQRFSSCLEYSSVKLSPSNAVPPQHKQGDSNHQGKEERIISPPESLPLSSSSKPMTRPVAKKRWSQLPNSDTSYSHADIESVLRGYDSENCTTSASFRENVSKDEKATSARRELFSNENCKVIDGKEKTHNLGTKLSASDISEVTEESKSKSNNITSSSISISSNDSNDKNITKNDKNTPNKNNNILPPLRRLQLARSPTAARRRFSSVFSSSVDNLSSPLTRTYYSGLSSSLADIPFLLEHDLHQPLSMLDLRLNNDDDDHDDENADDEMSVHNEESPLPKTPSLQNLLLSMSILDRSQAVARKRRQRLRNRKCRSQILSSTDVDDYYNNGIRKRPSRHSSKQKHTTSTTTNATNSTITSPLTMATSPTTTTTTTTTFSFDSIPNPVQSRRALYRHSKFLNHTDSGMDSDGASPFNSRDFQPVKDEYVTLKQISSPVSCTEKEDGSSSHKSESPGQDLGTSSNRKSWESRFHEQQGLKKSRSKEFLAYAPNTSRHLDKNVSVSNGFETLV